MKNRKVVYSSIGVGVILVIICGVIIWHISQFNNTKVAFLDIGQGDAILISRGSHQILIDGGPDGTTLMEQLGTQMPFWDRNIEIVIATHPDGDHIDGLISVFKSYSVDQFWHTNAGKDTSVYRALSHNANNEEGVEDVITYNGLQANIAQGVHLDVIYPFDENQDNVKDVNNTSITTVLTVGTDTFYFGGDLTSEFEDTLPIENITVLKAGHHGSKSSTSKKFLEKINPSDVIISSGKDNHYGHPHKQVLQNIEEVGARILRTDTSGSIVYRCDDKCKLLLQD